MLNKGNVNDLHSIKFQTRQDGDWVEVDLDNLMEDKTIVVFGLPEHSHQHVQPSNYLPSKKCMTSSKMLVWTKFTVHR